MYNVLKVRGTLQSGRIVGSTLQALYFLLYILYLHTNISLKQRVNNSDFKWEKKFSEKSIWALILNLALNVMTSDISISIPQLTVKYICGSDLINKQSTSSLIH